MGGFDFHVVVVGQCQTSKCETANALCNNLGYFTTFLCRLKVNLFKKNLKTLATSRTVKGHKLKVVVTPHINTPAWIRQVKLIKSLESKVLLYVENDDFVNIDHESYILKLHKWFQCEVICLQYSKPTGEQQCFLGSCDSFSGSQIIYTNITVNHSDSFKQKSETVQPVFQHISDIIIENRRRKLTSNIPFTGPSAVGDSSSVATETVDHSVNPIKDEEVDQDETSEGQCEYVDPIIVEELEERVWLPSLDDRDLELFAATLPLGTARSNHVRVNVVGNQEAGKTTLIQRLQDIEVDCPDNHRDATEGLVISQVTMKCVEKDGTRVFNTDVKGYEEELNLQRMAFAVQRTKEKRANEETSDLTPTENMPDSSIGETDNSLNQGSDCVEDILQSNPENTYAQQDEVRQKKLYLQKVKGWHEKHDNESMYISFWDFAGQSTYYSTHQAFMAPSSVYLLVFDLSVKLDKVLDSKLAFQTHVLKKYTVMETLKFWVSSIKAYTRDEENATAPFIIVGTHSDKVKKEQVEDTFGQIRRALKDVSDVEFIAIDNTRDNKTDSHLQSLKHKILDLGLGVIDEEISARWINLEETLLQKKNYGSQCLTFDEVMELDAKLDYPINNREEVLKFLEHKHRRGFLMFYRSDVNNEVIILDPSILANFFNTLLRKRPNTRIQSSFHNNKGIVLKKFVTDVAEKMFGSSPEIVDTIFATLQYLYIVHEFKEDRYFIPSLLQHRDAKEHFKESQQCTKLPTLRLSFKHAFIPPSFFHLLLSAINDKEGGLQIRHKDDDPVLFNLFASYIYHKATMRLDIYWQECKIYFELKNYSKLTSSCTDMWEGMVKIVEKKIEKVLSIYRQKNVHYHFEVQCPGCPQDEHAFIELDEIKCYDEAMCPKDHAVTMQDVFPGHPLKVEAGNKEKHEGHATHKDLGRLSRHLSENAESLAAKLKLEPCNATASKAVSSWPEYPEMQRFQLLVNWKQRNPESTKTALLHCLSKLKDHNYDDLVDVLNKQVKTCQYKDLKECVLKAVPSEIICSKVGDCIGKDWTFLMTELGLTFTALETARQENAHDPDARLRELLSTWTRQFPEEATIQVLLDTLCYIGVNTQTLIESIG